MKLAARFQRSNFLATLLIFLLASLAFYILLHRVLIFQVDEDLELEQHEIQNYVKRYGVVPQHQLPVEDRIIKIEPVDYMLQKPIKKTTLLRDEVEHEEGTFRQLIFTIQAGGKWYKISVSKSLEATEGLARSIGLIGLITIALLLITSFLINNFILQKLWSPFYQTIDRMRAFELGQQEKQAWPAVAIDEFALLNETLKTAIGKAEKDYKVLKEFTQNASHELQTPLAIIRSKLDLLIQEEQLSPTQSGIIQDTYDAVSRMAYLNKSLLTLARIEGGQYGERSFLMINELLVEKLINFESFIEAKSLKVEQKMIPSKLNVNPDLVGILLNNLISNAIHHNYWGGCIRIVLDSQSLSICNSSKTPILKEAGLFTRFYKTDSGTTRTGLGLAIVKQVCDASGLRIIYHFEGDDLHCFEIKW